LRPSEIGSPWAIRARGFFTEVLHQDRLHFGFVSAGDYVPPTDPPVMNGGGAASAEPMPAQPINGLPVISEPPAGAPAAEAGGPSSPPAGAMASGPASAPTGVAANADPAGYVSPLPRDANIGRTDMGVDVNLRPGEPIVAPGNSRVLGIMQNWYAGQPYVGLQFLDGPLKGRKYYIAEQIDPAVTPGQIVQRGQPIAHYAASGTGIEMGWAGPNWQETLAQAEGNTGDASHNDAPAGISFRNFLRTFGF